MKRKRNLKQEIKDWWNENKRVIKTGIVCLGIGFTYGFIKACDTMTHMRGSAMQIDYEGPCDELGLTESNCDDPELLELVNYEIENS